MHLVPCRAVSHACLLPICMAICLYMPTLGLRSARGGHRTGGAAPPARTLAGWIMDAPAGRRSTEFRRLHIKDHDRNLSGRYDSQFNVGAWWQTIVINQDPGSDRVNNHEHNPARYFQLGFNWHRGRDLDGCRACRRSRATSRSIAERSSSSLAVVSVQLERVPS